MTTLLFKNLLESLFQQRVKFVLVGGLAAIAHGMNYITNDVDICYDRSATNLTALVKALQPAKPKLRTVSGPVDFLFDEKTLKNGMNFTLDTDWGPVDLLAELIGVGVYNDLLKGSLKVDFYGFVVNTISLNDLIRAKEIAGRTKDQLHLLELRAIQKIKGT